LASSVSRAPYASPLAESLAEDVLARFVRYCAIDTQSRIGQPGYPSTAKQLDLSRLLEAELRELGAADVELTEHGYVLASVPGTADGPTVGLMAHVDTTPDVTGTGVKPLVHRAYAGGPIVLPGDPDQAIDPDESAELARRIGHDIVTSDGTTLLGADDKAGVAEIMAAVAYLIGDESRRAPLRIAFTVDEEIGQGTKYLDLERFGADVAYTLDGSGIGEIEIETFSAKAVTVRIRGHSVHPGTAKGKLVNGVKLAADIVASLPRDRLSPETTEGREGYVHPTRIDGNAEETRVMFIVRDHDDAKLDEHIAFLQRLVDEVAASEPRARITVDVQHSYSNMRPMIEAHPRVVEAAEEAIRRAGVEPTLEIIRGGTDGAELSARGLPTPNIFTGGRNYHSVREWACVQDRAAAAATVVELARVWSAPEP
jgi:tripeptide aminopeptidase